MSDGSGKRVTTATLPPLPPLPVVPLRRTLGAFVIDILLAILVGLVLMVVAGMLWGLIEGVRLSMAGAQREEITAAVARPAAIVQIVITMLGMGGAALLLLLWRRPAGQYERQQSLNAIKQPKTWLVIVTAAVAVFVFSTGMSWLGQWLGVPPKPSNIALIQEASAQAPWFVALFAIVLAPLYEEVLFRRVLFGRLWRAGHPLPGMILSGIVFALAHEIPGVSGNSAGATALLLAVYALMGMSFAWVYRRTGTLWAAIATHALNNALAMGLLSAAV